MGDFVEKRFDYSYGKADVAELTIMVGLSGSGKSTLVKGWLNWSQGRAVRLNRDDMRRMIYVDQPYQNHKDVYIRAVEHEMARMALNKGLNVYIDDTNCIRRTRYGWEELAKDMRVKFRIVQMTTPVEECIKRDAQRTATVGVAIIMKQLADLSDPVTIHDADKPQAKDNPTVADMYKEQLLNGGFTLRLPYAPIVIFDCDGTLCDHNGVRGPYEESRCYLDKPWPKIVEMAQSVYHDKNLFLVSGRKSRTGDLTDTWMKVNDVRYDCMLMRQNRDNRPDTVVKEEILDLLESVFGKEKIELIVDDRPQVIRMWRRRGYKVLAARGEDLPDF